MVDVMSGNDRILKYTKIGKANPLKKQIKTKKSGMFLRSYHQGIQETYRINKTKYYLTVVELREFTIFYATT